MGGDHAPQAVIEGALQALPLLRTTLILVGNQERIRALLPDPIPAGLEIVHASQVVEMHEKPLETYKKKKDSSIMVGVKLVKDGQADAFVSAGNTGAAASTSLLMWRQLDGIHRPAICSQLPNKYGGFALLDAGASPDIDPENILEFALMGRAYAQRVMGRAEPSVQLLNIGEEEGKGNAFSKAAYAILAKQPWFKGNIEGKDMFSKPCDIVVCDAFVGNVVLKTTEGIAELIVETIREGVPKNPIHRSLYWPVRKVIAPLRKQMDYAEVGGSPLLGLNHLCVICHGRSNAKAIKNALLMTQTALENRLVDTIREAITDSAGTHA